MESILGLVSALRRIEEDRRKAKVAVDTIEAIGLQTLHQLHLLLMTKTARTVWHVIVLLRIHVWVEVVRRLHEI